MVGIYSDLEGVRCFRLGFQKGNYLLRFHMSLGPIDSLQCTAYLNSFQGYMAALCLLLKPCAPPLAFLLTLSLGLPRDLRGRVTMNRVPFLRGVPKQHLFTFEKTTKHAWRTFSHKLRLYRVTLRTLALFIAAGTHFHLSFLLINQTSSQLIHCQQNDKHYYYFHHRPGTNHTPQQ